MLFAYLVMRRGPSEELKQTSATILQHLSLLFVPAGTGLMLHFHRLENEWLPITVALVASTFLAMGVTALVLKLMHGLRAGSEP
jgi:holin-like protein